MKLNRVQITNYRSIEDLTIDFNPHCRILVGINESGKSNILDALSLLSPDRKTTKEDKRVTLPEELEIKEAYARFIFDFELEEVKVICENIRNKVLTKNLDNNI